MIKRLINWWFYFKLKRRPFNPDDFEAVKRRTISFGKINKDNNLPYYLPKTKATVFNLNKD